MVQLSAIYQEYFPVLSDIAATQQIMCLQWLSPWRGNKTTLLTIQTFRRFHFFSVEAAVVLLLLNSSHWVESKQQVALRDNFFDFRSNARWSGDIYQHAK